MMRTVYIHAALEFEDDEENFNKDQMEITISDILEENLWCEVKDISVCKEDR